MTSLTEILVRYAETDQMGIVHHSNYAVWYEQARTEFIRCLGSSYGQIEKDGVWLPLLSLHCEFKSPAFYEDKLTIKTSIGLLTPSRIQFNYEVRRDEALLGCGFTAHAFTTPSLRPMNLKKHHPALYALLQRACEEDKP